MKTLQPLILTAHIAEHDLEPFDRLRQDHFPPARNFLRAHLTMFHRLPGEYTRRIVEVLEKTASENRPITADVPGVRHLGAGVAFMIASPELLQAHAKLKLAFTPWLGGQDMQKWQPHITIQNKVSRPRADDLYRQLSDCFEPRSVTIEGVELWRYLGGPWQLVQTIIFEGIRGSRSVLMSAPRP